MFFSEKSMCVLPFAFQNSFTPNPKEKPHFAFIAVIQDHHILIKENEDYAAILHPTLIKNPYENNGHLMNSTDAAKKNHLS